MKPCSGSGNQSVWTTSLGPHACRSGLAAAPLRLPAAAVPMPIASETASAAPIASARVRRQFLAILTPFLEPCRPVPSPHGPDGSCGVRLLTGTRVPASRSLLVPALRQLVADEADDPERDDPERAAEEQSAHQQVCLQVGPVEVEQAAEPGRALAEEELAHDRPDHGQPSRHAQP